ncbi:MAG TPA: DUF6547 family protein [Gemmataceae bacterium]|nr:DUF6547 family protein [Gemmataceae bacterium]
MTSLQPAPLLNLIVRRLKRMAHRWRFQSRRRTETLSTSWSICATAVKDKSALDARDGVWNQNATTDYLSDQHEINVLISRMSAADREVLAKMLASEVVTGVFETLKVLEQFKVPPFEDGYEGSPFNDFIGRLDDWQWPQDK